MEHILVTGATGTVGREVVKALHHAGITVSAGSRDTDKLEAIAADTGWDTEKVSFHYFDYDDLASMIAALEAVDGVFLVTPTIGNVEQMVIQFLKAADQSDLKHIVRLSGMRTADEPSTVHARCEEHIGESGIVATYLRPNFYMQNFNTFYADSIKQRGGIYLPAGDEPVSFIDVRDIAAVAASVFNNSDDHTGAVYTLTGGEAISHSDVAQTLSDVTGREIQYVAMPPEKFKQVIIDAGRPPEVADGINYLYAPAREGEAAVVTSHVADVAGKEPIPFSEYARDYAAVWV